MALYYSYWIILVSAALLHAQQGGGRRQPRLQDEAEEERTNIIDQDAQLEMRLTPTGPLNLMEGEDVNLNCKVRNRPQNSQLQWYYIIREDDGSISNFTILANEVATLDNDKYRVGTIPPNIYTLEIRELKAGDSGEYCCFLYVSYSETYRKTTQINIQQKRPPPSTAAPYQYLRREGQYSKLEKIIENAVEMDIEQELGHKFNITKIKSNAKAQALIHEATEQIKTLLESRTSNLDTQNLEELSQQVLAQRMQGISSQVKTVVTSLLTKMTQYNITSVNTTSIHTQVSGGGARDGESGGGARSGDRTESASRETARTTTSNPRPARPPRPTVRSGSVGGQRSGITSQASEASQASGTPDWRSFYNQYRSRVSNPSGEVNSDPQPSRVEEPENIDNVVSEQTTPRSARVHEQDAGATKCEYHLIVNEFDPTKCPSLGSGEAAAAKYYESNNRSPVKSEVEPITNQHLERLENKILDEMVNNKMVNETVKMHDDMLTMAERKLNNQEQTIAELKETVQRLEKELSNNQEEKENMDEKLTGVMLNILEINKRLDMTMAQQSKEKALGEKLIPVESSTLTIQCDRHPNVTYFKDCSDVATSGAEASGVYYIKVTYSACPIPVWCDLDTQPGGWLVIQRRESGEVDFNRGWDDYRNGFGEINGEHWIGNDNLFLLTNQDDYMLRIDLWDFYSSRVFAEYLTFRVSGVYDGYRLTALNYSGTAGDGFKLHDGVQFSTPDKDLDMWNDYHCASEWEGGWWFTNCWSAFLNGMYYNTANPPYQGISWRDWKEEQLSRVEMKIRPLTSASNRQADESRDEQMQSDEPYHGSSGRPISRQGKKNLVV